MGTEELGLRAGSTEIPGGASSRCHRSHQHSPGKTQPQHKREISGKKKPQSKELLQTTHPVVQVAAGAFTPYFMQQIM